MLTHRQRAFVDHFVLTGQGALSAREAGFSKHTARIYSAKLLAKGNIRAAIAAKQADLALKLDLSGVFK